MSCLLLFFRNTLNYHHDDEEDGDDDDDDYVCLPTLFTALVVLFCCHIMTHDGEPLIMVISEHHFSGFGHFLSLLLIIWNPQKKESKVGGNLLSLSCLHYLRQDGT